MIRGLYSGVLLMIEKVFLLKYLLRCKVISRIYTFILAVISWIIFLFDDISHTMLFGRKHILSRIGQAAKLPVYGMIFVVSMSF